MVGLQDHDGSPFRRLFHRAGDHPAVRQIGAFLIPVENGIPYRIRRIVRDPERFDPQVPHGTAPGNHPHLGPGQLAPDRQLGPGLFTGEHRYRIIVPGEHIQSGNMVPVLMGQEHAAQVFRLQSTAFQSLDDPPAGNPRIDQDGRLSRPDQGGIAFAAAGQYIYFKIRQTHSNTVPYKNVGAIVLTPLLYLLL